jgi:hypothetical protein
VSEALLKELVAAFKEGWGTANWLGLDGSRTLIGLGEALPVALLAYTEWLATLGLLNDRIFDWDALVLDFLKEG